MLYFVFFAETAVAVKSRTRKSALLTTLVSGTHTYYSRSHSSNNNNNSSKNIVKTGSCPRRTETPANVHYTAEKFELNIKLQGGAEFMLMLPWRIAVLRECTVPARCRCPGPEWLAARTKKRNRVVDLFRFSFYFFFLWNLFRCDGRSNISCVCYGVLEGVKSSFVEKKFMFCYSETSTVCVNITKWL